MYLQIPQSLVRHPLPSLPLSWERERA